MQKSIKLSLICVAFLSSLNAQETKNIELKPLTITSTAIQTDELKSTDAIEVYTQKDIQNSHAKNIYEFLNKETSVVSMPNWGNPFTQKLDMRGYGIGDGYQNIVVTINGRKMNNVDMVPQLLSSISPASIKKIEIIKSSGIVTGGDGANAGVINIVTKKSNNKEISFYLGNYGLADGSFYIGHRDDKLAVSATGESQKSSGIKDINTKGDKDRNQFSTGTFSLEYTPIEELEFRLGASFARTDVTYAGSMTLEEYKENPKNQGSVDYGWGPIPSPSTHQKYDSDALSGGMSYYINDNFSINADMHKEKKKSNFITYNSIYNYDYVSYTANINYSGDKLSIKAGIDDFDGNIKRNNMIDLNKLNRAYFVMSEFYLDDFTLKAGYRYEEVKFENEKNTDNKKDCLNGVELGMNYQLDNTKSVFIGYSHSYQSASLDRLFNFFTGVYSGYVKPAIANNYSAGYNYINRMNKLKISVYYTALEDEIYYYSAPWPNSKNTNIDKSHKYGLDLYDKYIINEKFNAMLNYNYVQAIIDDEKENGDDYSGNKLPGVSEHNIKITVNYLPTVHATISLTQVWRSEAYAAEDFNNDFTQKQDAYNSTDIMATYKKDKWEIFGKINNLFNQKNGLWIKDDAIYPVNYTTTAYVGLKLKY